MASFLITAIHPEESMRLSLKFTATFLAFLFTQGVELAAAPILRYQFTAHISTLPGSIAGVDMPLGTVGVGTFMYDVAVPDQWAGDTRGVFRQQRPNAFTFDVLNLSIRAEDVVFETDTSMNGVFMVHNLGTGNAVTINGNPALLSFLFGFTGIGTTTDALPQSLILGDANNGALNDVPPESSPFFRIDSLTPISPTPEPSSLLLLATGALTVFLVFRARRSS